MKPRHIILIATLVVLLIGFSSLVHFSAVALPPPTRTPTPTPTPTRTPTPTPTPCVPKWVETSRQQIGGFQKNWIFYCEYWAVYEKTEHDTNCNYGDRIRCDEVLKGRMWGVGTNCCSPNLCWGIRCSEWDDTQ